MHLARLALLAVLPSLACAAGDPQPVTLDLGAGTVSAPAGSEVVWSGTTDSHMGRIAIPRTAGGEALVVSYDIGFLAGTRAHEGLRGECGWFDVQIDAAGRTRTACARAELLVTLTAGGRSVAYFPANFWAPVRSEAERDLVLDVASSYQPASPTEAVQVWVPRGVEVVTDAAGEHAALTLEADPVPLGLSHGRVLGHRVTWSPGAGGAADRERVGCGARLQGVPGPAGATRAEVVVFETAVPCAHPWSPEAEGYRELHRATVGR